MNSDVQECKVYFNCMYISRGGLVSVIGLCAVWICADGFVVKVIVLTNTAWHDSFQTQLFLSSN